MSIDVQTALARINSELVEIGKERLDRGETFDFTDLRDAMLTVHCVFQEFIRSIKDKRDVNSSIKPGLQLAATLIKLIVDLTKSQTSKSFEQKSSLLEKLLITNATEEGDEDDV